MQIAFGPMPPTGPLSGPGGTQTSAATTSFTHMPMESWTTQRLDSPTGQRFVQAIAQATGLSATDVTQQIQNGTTVQQLLQANGATFADVRHALRSQAGQVHFGTQHGGVSQATAEATLGAIAKTLGISVSNLEQQLSSGVSLSSLASSHGVSEDQLLGSIQDALQSFLGYAANGAQSGTGTAASSGLQLDTTA